MSATPNNAGADWGGLTAGPPDHNLDAPVPIEAGDGRDALQALLAFACIHQQATKRDQLKNSGTSRSASKQHAEEVGLDDVLRLVAARAVAITGADGVAIALAEEDAIVCRASAGKTVPDPGVRLDPNSGFSGACLRSGQSVRCDDSETDARVNAQACRGLGARSMVAVPLSAKQRVVGLIEAFSSATFGFNDSDVRSLNLLAELVLAAIRPEEEDRLAELAKRIVPEPPPAEPQEAEKNQPAPPIAAAAARVIVDEAFAPAPVPQQSAALPLTKTSRDLQPAPEVKPSLAAERATRLHKDEELYSRIAVIAALMVVAVGLGWAVVWKARHIGQSISANTQATESGRLPGAELPDRSSGPALALKSGANPQVTGIRHWSAEDSSTVVVDLEDQVQYEAHSLDNPRRIYFDLHDTKMAPGLLNQSIVVDDALLKRVRMAQPVQDVTRVVLETKGEAEFSVKLDSSPYRLTIEVHKPAATTKTTPEGTSKPSPAIELSPRKSSASSDSRAHLSELRIVLDAGHGGWDLGTVGKKGLLEKDLVLDIVQRLGQMIEKKLGAEVIYTRQEDSYLPLEKRAEVANVARADLFLSVHANYSDLATARGVETYYTNTYSSLKARTADDTPTLKNVDWTGVDIRAKVTDSRRLASDVQQALYGALASRTADIRNRGVKEAQYVVLTGTQMPAVLAEVSFVSSPADEDKLQSSEYRQQIADALFSGIAKYHNETKRSKLASLQRPLR